MANELTPELIRSAYYDNRLFVVLPELTDAELRENGIQAILVYVSRIDFCSSERYQPFMHEMWERILRDSILGNCFFMEKGKCKNKPNWYRVTMVVGILRERNVYRKDEFNFLQLHLLLEETTRRNGRYSGSTLYYLDYEVNKLLMKIIDEYGLL